MKQLLVIGLMVMSVFSFARDRFDGCGLGWEVTDKKTMSATTTRATTNATVPPTLGMTSGTLGCETFSGFASVEQPKVEYVSKNYDVIKMDLALGYGEYAKATEQAFECEGKGLVEHIQNNFETVVSPASDGIELYENIKEVAQRVCS